MTVPGFPTPREQTPGRRTRTRGRTRTRTGRRG